MKFIPTELRTDYIVRLLNAMVASGSGTPKLELLRGGHRAEVLINEGAIYDNHVIVAFDFESPAFSVDKVGVIKFNLVNPGTVIYPTEPYSYTNVIQYKQVTKAHIYNGNGDLVFYVTGYMANYGSGVSPQIEFSVGDRVYLDWYMPSGML